MPRPAEMLELHRYKHIEWKPSPIVALATSIDETAVATARGNGSIEIWIVSPGSVGWYCEFIIPGKKEASISCLLWCPSSSSTRGRLFSAGLDGFITEWDLLTLRAKEVSKSYGGSVWQMALEPARLPVECRGVDSPEHKSSISTDSDEDTDGEDHDGDSNDYDESASVDQRVAVACDDGCLRLFTVNDGESFTYHKSFPRVKGRILSAAWSTDGSRVFSGGSDGCIRCWATDQSRELYRITAGLGGSGNNSTLCIWSIITLRDGTVVSGDSTGSTQFWDGKQGTLLQAHAGHKADVLALAASPSHQSVFAAGADGQVVQYQLVPQSKVLNDTSRNPTLDMGIGMGDRWIFVGGKRTHTHDVNALVVACPLVLENGGKPVIGNQKSRRNWRKKVKRSWLEQSQFKAEDSGIPMLVSGGNDAKLFTYPANAFLAFHPHDVCAAPQCTPILLASRQKLPSEHIMLAQFEHQVEVWRITINSATSGKIASNDASVGPNQASSPSSFGKRKSQEVSHQDNKRRMANGHLQRGKSKAGDVLHRHCQDNSLSSSVQRHAAKMKGSSPELLARIKCNSTENITCSALSETGQFVAFSDQSKTRLFELEQRSQGGAIEAGRWGLKKRMPPKGLPPAHSMVFCGSSRLLLASLDNTVSVVDIGSPAVVHLAAGKGLWQHVPAGASPITKMCTSSDEQWLATCNSRGDVFIFNLKTLRQHWHAPPLDGSHVTLVTFHPKNSSILFIATNTNMLYTLDVEAKSLGEWSKHHGQRLPKSFLEFPGGIQGLSVSPSKKLTRAIAYSSSAMCIIDFQKPIPTDESKVAVKPSETVHISNKGFLPSSKHAQLPNGHGDRGEKNFVVVPFKDPVLFIGHSSDRLVLVVEKPWLDAISQLPPPVYRHLYGT